MEEITRITNIETFSKGIQAKKPYSKNLSLSLWCQQIADEGAKALATALQSGQCPQGLVLDLPENEIGDEGAKALAIALQSGQCPQGLRLNLDSNQLGSEGAKALASALHSGQCPQGLQLYLADNLLGTEGTKALAMALHSGQCPQGLQLDLGYNQLSADGVNALAFALQSGQCPQGLQLCLGYNQLGDEGAKAFAIALQSGQCPQGLQLDLSHNQIGAEGEKILQKAWAVYYTHQQDNFINCMTLHQGHSQVDSPITRLPREILQEISHHALPATPILAKMTEISAKVFREQLATLKLADTSEQAKQFDKALEIALSSKKFTEKAVKIKTEINDFLQQELELLETKKFIPSHTVALLCKYHLLAKNHVYQSPSQPDRFQLNELALKKSPL